MKPKKILIIEDENDIIYALRLLLEQNNYEVIEAEDGRKGFDIARRERPDLILLDLMLPKLDGYKVCRMLKFDEKYKKTPVIMLTARTQDSDKATGREVGADAYITKPFNQDILLTKIKQLLGEA